MKRFRLNIVLLVGGIVLFSAGAALAFAGGDWRLGVPAAVLAVILIAGLFVLIGRFTGLMSMFVSALEMNDSTMRFDIGRDDGQLRRVSDAMNRIMGIYRSNRIELETRKLYYDRILSVMTHEMRNAITPVVALTDDMTAHPDKYRGDDLADALSLISDQSSGIKKFLDSYSQLTHLPKPQIESVASVEFVNQIREIMVLEISNRGMAPDVISYMVGADMVMNVDRDLMRQAIVNLLRNALDAVASKGGDGRVEMRVTLSDGTPYIYITDNGNGIPASVQSNLFQPFITTKQGGSGIGLYLSRQIARLHGGDLTLSSSASRGTVAVVKLQN